jgi:hypothetical protein
MQIGIDKKYVKIIVPKILKKQSYKKLKMHF